jgi:hypothetical protein
MARQFNQFIKNRYQQTWHTIEFSNNRHTRHHPNQTFRIAPEQLFKLTRSLHPSQTGGFCPAQPVASGSPCRLAPWSGAEINYTTTSAECQPSQHDAGEGPEPSRIPSPPPSERTVRVAAPAET